MRLDINKNFAVDLRDALPVTLGDMCALEAKGIDLTNTTNFKMSTVQTCLEYFVSKTFIKTGKTIEEPWSVGELDVDTAGKAFRFILTSNKKYLDPN